MSDKLTDFNHLCFWIGGSPCAGKSSVTNLLAAQFGLTTYHVDDHFNRHAQHLDPIRQPALTRWLAASWNQRWMQPPDQLLREVIDCYQEHMTLVLEDLFASATDASLLVEGSALIPQRLGEMDVPVNHAIWLVPTAEFQRNYYSQRTWIKGILRQCDAPEQAFENWMERDSRFAHWVAEQARKFGYPVLIVDGAESIEEIAHRVAAHLGLTDKIIKTRNDA